jgi:nickel/cobalt transporter (NicO) family protein
MTQELMILTITAASIGFVHTLFGPDHYLPFIMMAKAQNWTGRKTALVTVLCGFGHVLSSVVFGFIGIALGIAVGSLEGFEGIRGNLAAWGLIAFGATYFAWGVRRAMKNKPHSHEHKHADGLLHHHHHAHHTEHAHAHEAGSKKTITPWVLFTIFVLGPCEPLIPILMYPAAKMSMSGVILVVAVFSAVTIGTMLAVVGISSWGLTMIPLGRVERYTHALAGGAICLSGLAIQCLGL